MSGETQIAVLLAELQPLLQPASYVFCSLPAASYGDHAELQPVASFVEPEGLTLVVKQSQADRLGWPYEACFRCVTLKVHSSLQAVGLTAAVSTSLAEHHISANMLAGYYHDHLFVPAEQAELAVQVLQELSQKYKNTAQQP